MIKFEFNYDGSELISKGEATLLQVAQDICNKAGVELSSTSFLNSDKKVSVYDNTVTAREYISYIAESAGCFACIDRKGKLCFREFGQDETEIPLEMFGEYKWGEEFKISKVSYEDGVRSFKFGDDTRNNLWINQENMYIVDEDQVQKIYNKIKDLTVNTFEGKVIIDPAIDIGDKIVINGKNVIYQGEMSLEGRFIAQISSKIQIKQKEETTVKKESQKVVNRRVQSRINQAEGKIEQLVEENSEQSQKLTKVEQTVNGITQSVSKVEEKVATVENTANTAKTTADSAKNIATTAGTNASTAISTANTAKATADTAKSTADSTNKNLTTNYYTKTQTENKITQTAESTISEVSKTYSTKTETSTAKSEAINSANTATDNKLKGYTETSKLGTAIEQNYEHVKVAWNQISDFIQMMIINKNASLAILDKDKNVLSYFDKTGEHFCDTLGNKIGTIGVVKEEDKDVLAFAMNVDWNSVNESKSMAWGYFDKNGKFLPIFHLIGTYGGENSEYGGKLSLEGDLTIDEALYLIKSGLYFGDYLLDGHGGNLSFINTNTSDNIFKLSINYMQLGSFLTAYKDTTGDSRINFYDAYFENIKNVPLSADIKEMWGNSGFLAIKYESGDTLYLFADSSDRKLKQNIKNSKENALDKIKQIKHRQFDWKSNNQHQSIGYIAQEMNKIDKNFVHYNKYTTSNGREKEDWQINTLSVLATATKAIQEQQEQIEQLQAKDKQKDELIQSLIQRIETLEKEVNK